MPGPRATPFPATPAEVASAILEAIAAQPEAFTMEHWAMLLGVHSLVPDEAPACGSTLCAAGWAAHVTGWTLVSLPFTDADGASQLDDAEALEFTTILALGLAARPGGLLMRSHAPGTTDRVYGWRLHAGEPEPSPQQKSSTSTAPTTNPAARYPRSRTSTTAYRLTWDRTARGRLTAIDRPPTNASACKPRTQHDWSRDEQHRQHSGWLHSRSATAFVGQFQQQLVLTGLVLVHEK